MEAYMDIFKKYSTCSFPYSPELKDLTIFMCPMKYLPMRFVSERLTSDLPALCLLSAAPDTAGGPQLHPEALPGEAKVPGGPRGLPEALRPHQQPAEENPP